MSRTCSDCASHISRQSKTGRCRSCATRVTGSNRALIERRRMTRVDRRGAPPPLAKTCATCPETLGAKNKSGRCRACLARQMNADPEMRARQNAGIREWFTDPENVEAARNKLRGHMANLSEAERERRRERGRWLHQNVLTKPEVIAKRNAAQSQPEVQARRGQSLSDRLLPWCPRELRPLYREIRAGGTPPAEARVAVEELIPGTAAHTARELANHQLAARMRRERDLAQAY